MLSQQLRRKCRKLEELKENLKAKELKLSAYEETIKILRDNN